jgi:hypothetical protein
MPQEPEGRAFRRGSPRRRGALCSCGTGLLPLLNGRQSTARSHRRSSKRHALAFSEARRGESARADETGRVRRGRVDRRRSKRASHMGRAPGSTRSGCHSAGAFPGRRAGEPLSEAVPDEASLAWMRGSPVQRGSSPRRRLLARQGPHEGRRGCLGGRAVDPARSGRRQRRRRGHSAAPIHRACEGVDPRRVNAARPDSRSATRLQARSLHLQRRQEGRLRAGCDRPFRGVDDEIETLENELPEEWLAARWPHQTIGVHLPVPERDREMPGSRKAPPFAPWRGSDLSSVSTLPCRVARFHP